MKPRRRKGATLGLVAVSVLVIIVIGIGCYFLIKLCGGGREVANSTDAGTLNVAKAALRTKYASAVVPPGIGGYQNFLACLDPAISDATTQRISLLTYNRCVAQALLIAINAQDTSGSPQAVTFANLVWNDLQKIGHDISLSTTTDNRWRDAAFSGLASNNSLKMFGNNTLSQTNYKWAYMRQGSSSNVFFSAWTFGTITDPGTGNSFTYPEKTNGVPPQGLVYTGPEAVTFRPIVNSTTTYTAYTDLGNNGVTGPNAAYPRGNGGQYMAGYQAIGPVNGHNFYGVPVFPQQRPHLVQLGEFNASMTSIDPDNDTPPNAFSITTKSLDSKSTNFGGAVAAAIVGTTFSQNGGGDLAGLGAGGPSGPGPAGGTGYQGQALNQFDFIAELPDGYIQIKDEPAAGMNPNFNGVPDGANNIFNWELNPDGGGVGVNLTPSASGNIFFQDSGTAGNTVQAWADYDNATPPQPQPPATWVDTTTGQVTTGAPQGSLAGIFVATNNGQSSQPATAADMKGLPPNPKQLNCLADLMNNNLNYPPGSGACYNNLGAMSSGFGRAMAGNGPVDPTTQQYWSNVDQIKAQIAAAFNQPAVTVQAPGGQSGLGAYKVPKTGAGTPAIAWNAGSNPPLEKVSSVMDILKQVGGCATTDVVNGIWQRCNQITPGVSYNDVVGLLSSTTIGMGQTLYIQRSDPTKQNSPLCVKTSPPQSGQVQALLANPTYGPLLPDGLKQNFGNNPTNQAPTCASGNYDLYNGGNGLVDTRFGNNGDGKGDDNLHDQPYTNVQPTDSLQANDHANFVTSSGFGGMLGKLDFFQTTSGSATFSRPN